MCVPAGVNVLYAEKIGLVRERHGQSKTAYPDDASWELDYGGISAATVATKLTPTPTKDYLAHFHADVKASELKGGETECSVWMKADCAKKARSLNHKYMGLQIKQIGGATGSTYHCHCYTGGHLMFGQTYIGYARGREAGGTGNYILRPETGAHITFNTPANWHSSDGAIGRAGPWEQLGNLHSLLRSCGAVGATG
jgi:hypothetical protein